MVIIVDDAQWLDAESVEILGFVARRLYAEQLGLLFSVREPLLQPLLEGIPALHIGGLEPEDAVELLLSLAPNLVDRQVAQKVAEQSRGNPLVIVEVSRELNLFHSPGVCCSTIRFRWARSWTSTSGTRSTNSRTTVSTSCSTPRRTRTRTQIWYGRRQRWKGSRRRRHSPPSRQGWCAHHRPSSSATRSSGQRCTPVPTRNGDRRTHTTLASLADPDRGGSAGLAPRLRRYAARTRVAAAALEKGARAARSRGGYLSEAAYLARAAELSPAAAATSSPAAQCRRGRV